MQQKIFHIETESLEEFERAAHLVKSLGGTHMMVGDLPRSHWMWDCDRSDPYPNWSMGHAPLFLVECPRELAAYLPQDFIQRNHDLVVERSKILAKIGLKGAFYSNEPFWLPEQVYRDHPGWRGARCDHPRRSRKPYYSPNIDSTEVLALYRDAMYRLCKETGIDFFIIMSNDSGAGIAWSSGTYVGANGPMNTRFRPMAERVCGFMDALSEGARQAGIEAVIHLNANIDFKEREAAMDTIWPLLKKGQVVNDRDCTGKCPILCFANPFQSKPPILGIPRMFSFADYLQRVVKSESEYLVLDLPRTDLMECEQMIGLVQNGKTAAHRYESYGQILECARRIAGEEAANDLFEAWKAIDESFLHLSHTGLDLMMYGCQHQRWINRPFVLFPQELSEEETAYWRPYQFQAMTPERADDLMDLQGIEGVRGFTATFLVTQTMNQAIQSVNQALQSLENVSKVCKVERRGQIERLILRLKAQRCFFYNVIHAAQFQELKDRTNWEKSPELSLWWPTRNDARIQEFQNISRAEIENVLELADLIEGQEKGLLAMSQTQEEEDIFFYGPNLASQLRQKADIMWNHMLDANRVYETDNV